ncbi:hypothetical protein BKH43_01575 [Helicobacter sp. 13S00401-1]|uniref:glucosyltransferase domain-containing protein n=1 Tax=Helicobacter sp. 13S00401-1 TaxID=1905758 RepID=UPI000BA5D7F6|nr:glucosyltransferase domain-containing protein [Helicobacter sp. 13S00401-1]PAF51356.1 hypothetical protein BKH43_01575 [Helicobacter sp. 13S00401-1]
MRSKTHKTKQPIYIYISKLKKAYKLAFSIWIVLAILLFIFTIVLSALSYNKTYKANLNVISVNQVGLSYEYHAKLHFKSNLFRVQENISTMTILDINYKENIAKSSITNLSTHLQYINFKSPQKLEGNIASINYKVSFLPLYKKLALAFIGGLMLIFIVSEVRTCFKVRVCEFIASPNFLKIFIISVVIYLVALSALLRGDVYYIDDFGRAVGQGDDWIGFSRYIAKYLYNIINSFQSFPYTDISPLPQLLAVIILSLSGMLVSYIVRKKLDILGIIATLPLGLSPYFLENLSYKFDSPLMSFSLFILLVPFLFKDNLKHFIYISFIALLLSLSTYQASNGIYIIFTLLLVLTNYLYKEKSIKENLKFLGSAVLSFIVAMLVYKYFIATQVNGYVSSYAMSFTKILEGGNLKIYLSYIFSDLKDLPFFIFSLVIALLFILACTFNSKQTKLLSFISSIVFLALGLCLFSGAYLVLSKPLLYPRAFIGFGAFIALVYINLFYMKNSKILKVLNVVFVALGSYSLVVFASSYGNAISAQQSYMMQRAGFLAKDLSTLVSREAQTKTGIVFEGSIGYSPVTDNFIKRYGSMAQRLIPITLLGNPLWPWNRQPLIYQGTNYKSYNEAVCAPQNTTAKKKLVLDNAYQSIYKSNSCYFVDLKPSTWKAR